MVITDRLMLFAALLVVQYILDTSLLVKKKIKMDNEEPEDMMEALQTRRQQRLAEVNLWWCLLSLPSNQKYSFAAIICFSATVIKRFSRAR